MSHYYFRQNHSPCQSSEYRPHYVMNQAYVGHPNFYYRKRAGCYGPSHPPEEPPQVDQINYQPHTRPFPQHTTLPYQSNYYGYW